MYGRLFPIKSGQPKKPAFLAWLTSSYPRGPRGPRTEEMVDQVTETEINDIDDVDTGADVETTVATEGEEA